MVSAAEQLAKNANWSALAKATELKQRLLFVLGALLLVYRLGTYIPGSRHRSAYLERNFLAEGRRHSRHVQHVLGRCLAAYDNLCPEHHALHFGLHYHAARNCDVATARGDEERRRDGGRVKINQYTRLLTVLLATVQAYGLAVGLESMHGSSGSGRD
jgi:preprotein translocase subunit SecY